MRRDQVDDFARVLGQHLSVQERCDLAASVGIEDAMRKAGRRKDASVLAGLRSIIAGQAATIALLRAGHVMAAHPGAPETKENGNG